MSSLASHIKGIKEGMRIALIAQQNKYDIIGSSDFKSFKENVMSYHKEIIDSITDENATIRIKRIRIENFKNVESGELVFNCGRKDIPAGTSSDVLGIYGQNGSGKTAVIEALAILKLLLQGDTIPSSYTDDVMNGKWPANLEFLFDFQHPVLGKLDVSYKFSLSPFEKESSSPDGSDNEPVKALHVFNEVLSFGGVFCGLEKKFQPLIDTSSDEQPFGPVSKRKLFIKPNKATLQTLLSKKNDAYKNSHSFIFSEGFLESIDIKSGDTYYIMLLYHLIRFAMYSFFVVDTKAFGLISSKSRIPLYYRYKEDNAIITGRLQLIYDKPSLTSQKTFELLTTVISNLNTALKEIIPGLTLEYRSMSPAIMKDGSTGCYGELIAHHNGIEIPFRNESDGIKKIVSTLQLFIAAFNDKSVTVAIDEFDAGVFEYLLGELVEAFQESGQGQLVFTSHNLRPLEVLRRDYICFTTTNPQNRYIRFENIRPSNNLRDTYYREIILGNQKEKVYDETKRYRMITALRKAGVESAGET